MSFKSFCYKQKVIKAPVWRQIMKRWFGQPVHQTHPHMMTQQDVTPGISKQEYALRRSNLWSRIVGEEGRKVVLIPSSSKCYMAHEVPYPFRQDTDFLYFSGFQEPDSILLLTNLTKKNDADFTSILFVPRRDEKRELWDGPRTGFERAPLLTGVQEAHNVDNFQHVLSLLTVNQPPFHLFYNHQSPTHSHFHQEYFEKLCHKASKVHPISNHIQPMRLVKSASEQHLMSTACSISSHAFTTLFKHSSPGVEESHLEALMDFECRMNGATRLAYPPVVAGGNRANTIHYIDNNQRVMDGEMVLVDAGCEYHGYSSDITRTWPVNGHFSAAQRDMYEALLEVQQACVRLCTPNKLSLNQMHVIMVTLIGKQLKRLKIVKESAGEAEVRRMTLELCPHHLSHYLGMDVHDTDQMSRNNPLQPGTVVTIEPGLYIQQDNTAVAAEWRGVGMRIEDDVMVTNGDNPLVLTMECPKDPAEIEVLVQGR